MYLRICALGVLHLYTRKHGRVESHNCTAFVKRFHGGLKDDAGSSAVCYDRIVLTELEAAVEVLDSVNVGGLGFRVVWNVCDIVAFFFPGEQRFLGWVRSRICHENLGWAIVEFKEAPYSRCRG